jgi:hypothetical protein
MQRVDALPDGPIKIQALAAALARTLSSLKPNTALQGVEQIGAVALEWEVDG